MVLFFLAKSSILSHKMEVSVPKYEFSKLGSYARPACHTDMQEKSGVNLFNVLNISNIFRGVRTPVLTWPAFLYKLLTFLEFEVVSGPKEDEIL